MEQWIMDISCTIGGYIVHFSNCPCYGLYGLLKYQPVQSSSSKQNTCVCHNKTCTSLLIWRRKYGYLLKVLHNSLLPLNLIIWIKRLWQRITVFLCFCISVWAGILPREQAKNCLYWIGTPCDKVLWLFVFLLKFLLEPCWGRTDWGIFEDCGQSHM